MNIIISGTSVVINEPTDCTLKSNPKIPLKPRKSKDTDVIGANCRSCIIILRGNESNLSFSEICWQDCTFEVQLIENQVLENL